MPPPAPIRFSWAATPYGSPPRSHIIPRLLGRKASLVSNEDQRLLRCAFEPVPPSPPRETTDRRRRRRTSHHVVFRERVRYVPYSFIAPTDESANAGNVYPGRCGPRLAGSSRKVLSIGPLRSSSVIYHPSSGPQSSGDKTTSGPRPSAGVRPRGRAASVRSPRRGKKDRVEFPEGGSWSRAFFGPEPGCGLRRRRFHEWWRVGRSRCTESTSTPMVASF
mmetsp:Transcript_3398/g.5932  ORF Transcript_3398/g.5932 Transcript_3398/m.5932 type:complete len:220 (-) Transcript_3398:94-753(-)